MSRRKALEIKKDILHILQKHGEISLRELDIKANTNSTTLRTQVEELEYFGCVVVSKHQRNEKNGRPFTTVKLKQLPPV